MKISVPFLFMSALLFALCSAKVPMPSREVELEQKDRCFLKPEMGPCEAYFPKYFYDSVARVRDYSGLAGDFRGGPIKHK